MKGKGSMHHEKEVTSQVLRGKPQPKRYSNASAMRHGVAQSMAEDITLLILFQTRRTCNAELADDGEY